MVEIFARPLLLPVSQWRAMGKGWVDLHGHSHGRLKSQPWQFDVGVDVWGFRPVTLREILQGRRR
jgi:calcineurin-like phosphoesterase family protein